MQKFNYHPRDGARTRKRLIATVMLMAYHAELTDVAPIDLEKVHDRLHEHEEALLDDMLRWLPCYRYPGSKTQSCLTASEHSEKRSRKSAMRLCITCTARAAELPAAPRLSARDDIAAADRQRFADEDTDEHGAERS